jgi:hypothetical protein
MNLQSKNIIYEIYDTTKNQIFEWVNDSSFFLSVPEGKSTYIKQINFYERHSETKSVVSTRLIDSISKFRVLIPQTTIIKNSVGLYFINNEVELLFFDLLNSSFKKVFSFEDIGSPTNFGLSSKGNFLFFTIVEDGIGNLYSLNLNDLKLINMMSSKDIINDTYVFSLKNEDVIAYYLYEEHSDTLRYVKVVFYDIPQRQVLCSVKLEKNQYPSLMLDFPTENSVLIYYFKRDIPVIYADDSSNVHTIFAAILESIGQAISNVNLMFVDYQKCMISN